MPTEMTMREHYVGVALQGLIASGNYGVDRLEQQRVAEDAIDLADLIINRLEMASKDDAPEDHVPDESSVASVADMIRKIAEMVERGA